jgi:hypothetical protein
MVLGTTSIRLPPHPRLPSLRVVLLTAYSSDQAEAAVVVEQPTVEVEAEVELEQWFLSLTSTLTLEPTR